MPHAIVAPKGKVWRRGKPPRRHPAVMAPPSLQGKFHRRLASLTGQYVLTLIDGCSITLRHHLNLVETMLRKVFGVDEEVQETSQFREKRVVILYLE